MSQLIDIDNSIFPPEISFKIIYNFGGLQHKCAKIINDYICSELNFKCFICNSTNDALSYINYSYISHILPFISEKKKRIMEMKPIKKLHICFGCAH